MPLGLHFAKLSEYNATANFGQNRGHIDIKTAGGLNLQIKMPPVPESLVIESYADAPKPIVIGQQSISALLEIESSTAAITRDRRLSEIGQLEKLNPKREGFVSLLSFLHNDLKNVQAKLTEATAARYRVPPIGDSDVLGYLKEREIRDSIRQINSEERANLNGVQSADHARAARTRLMESIIKGDDPSLSLAILRSPVRFGEIEGYAMDGWKARIDLADPVGRDGLTIAAENIEWSRRVMAQVVGLVKPQLLGMSSADLFKVSSAANAADLFGFTEASAARKVG